MILYAMLPPDPEEMNDKRSGWAGEAIRVFMECTGTDKEDAVADLVADLGHWCDRNGFKFNHELARGVSMYEEEIEQIEMNIGDKVTWKSQAGGHWLEKTGVIVAVVAAGTAPVIPGGYSHRKDISSGRSRNHESYLVAVGSRLYWPVAGCLRLVESAPVPALTTP